MSDIDLMAGLNRISALSKKIAKSDEMHRILSIIDNLKRQELNKSMWARKSSINILDALEYEIITGRRF